MSKTHVLALGVCKTLTKLPVTPLKKPDSLYVQLPLMLLLLCLIKTTVFRDKQIQQRCEDCKRPNGLMQNVNTKKSKRHIDSLG